MTPEELAKECEEGKPWEYYDSFIDHTAENFLIACLVISILIFFGTLISTYL